MVAEIWSDKVGSYSGIFISSIIGNSKFLVTKNDLLFQYTSGGWGLETQIFGYG